MNFYTKSLHHQHKSTLKSKKSLLVLSLLTITINSALANIGRHDIDFTDYKSFANNFGKYTAGSINTIVYKTDGSLSGVIPKPISQFTDLAELFIGSAALYGNNEFATSATHVGNQNLNFNRRFNREDVTLFANSKNFSKNANIRNQFNPGSYTTRSYAIGGYKDVQYLRLNRLVYDAIPHPIVSQDNLTKIIKVGSYVARVGQGLTAIGVDSGQDIRGLFGGQVFAGGTNKVSYYYPNFFGITYPGKEDPSQSPYTYSPVIALKKNQATALDASSEPNDSGSPAYVWNEQDKTWYIMGANHGGSSAGYGKTSEIRINPIFADQVLNQYKNNINLDTINLSQQDDQHVLVNSQSYSSNAFDSSDLIFTHPETSITVTDKVNTGWGALTFNENATITASSPTSQLQTAGIIVNNHKTLTYNLNIGENHDLIKLGNGTLVINGNNLDSKDPSLEQSTLSVGDGTVILNSSHGPVANSIRIASGRATIVLNQEHQINNDNFYFGVKGGKLDLNGHNLQFNEIYHLDQGAQFTNSNSTTKSSLTFTNHDQRVFLGDFTGNLNVNYDPNQANSDSVWELRSANTSSNGDLNIKHGTLVINGDSVVVGSSRNDYGVASFKTVLPNINRSANVSFQNINVNDQANLVLGRASHTRANINIHANARLTLKAQGKVLDDINPWYLGQNRDWQVPINTITVDQSINFDQSTAMPSSFNAHDIAQNLVESFLPKNDNANLVIDLQNNHQALVNATVSSNINLFKTGTGEVSFNGDTEHAYGIVNLDQGTLRFNKANSVTNLAIASNNKSNILGFKQVLGHPHSVTSDFDVGQYQKDQQQANSNLSLILNNLDPNFVGTLSLNGEITALSETDQSQNNLVDLLNQHKQLFIGTSNSLDLGNKYQPQAILNTSLTTLNLGGDKGHLNLYGLANDQDTTTRVINLGSNAQNQGSLTIHGLSTHQKLTINTQGFTNLDIVDDRLGNTQDLTAQIHDQATSSMDSTTELNDLNDHSNYQQIINLGYGSSANYQLSSLVNQETSHGFLLIGAYTDNLKNLSSLDSQSSEAQELVQAQQSILTRDLGSDYHNQVVPVAPIEANLHTYHLRHLDLSNTNLAIGTSKYQLVTIDQLTANKDQDYNFAGSGTVVVNNALDTNAKAVNLDAQYHQGGVIVLNHNNEQYHGKFNLTGQKPELATSLTISDLSYANNGKITLVQGQDQGFGNGNVFNLDNGAIVNLNGFDAHLKIGKNTDQSTFTAYSNHSYPNPYKTNQAKVNLYLENDANQQVEVNTHFVGNLNVHFTNGAVYNLNQNTTHISGNYYVDHSTLNYADDQIGIPNQVTMTSEVHLKNRAIFNLIGTNLPYYSKLVADHNDDGYGDQASTVNLVSSISKQNINNLDLYQNLTINGLGKYGYEPLWLGTTSINQQTLTINDLNFKGLMVNDANKNTDGGTLNLNNSTYAITDNNRLSSRKFKQINLHDSTLIFNGYNIFKDKKDNFAYKYDAYNQVASIEVTGNSRLKVFNFAVFHQNLHVAKGNTLTITDNTEQTKNGISPHYKLVLNFNLSGDGVVNFDLTSKSPGQDIVNNFEDFTGTLDVSQALYGTDGEGTDYVGLNFTNWTGSNVLHYALAGNDKAIVKNTSQNLITTDNNKARKDHNNGKTITLTNLENYHGTLVADEGNFIFDGQKALAGDYKVKLRQGDFLVNVDQNQGATTGNFKVESTNQDKFPVVNLTKTSLGTLVINQDPTLKHIVGAKVEQGSLVINTNDPNAKLFHQNFTYNIKQNANLEINTDTNINFVVRNSGEGNLVINQTHNHQVNINMHDLHLTSDTITIQNGVMNQILTDTQTTTSHKLAGTGTWQLSQGKLGYAGIDPTNPGDHSELALKTCGEDTFGKEQLCTEQQLFGENADGKISSNSQADSNHYHLAGYGETDLDNNYRVLTLDKSDILANFKGNLVFNKNVELYLNYANPDLNHIKLKSLANTKQHIIKNISGTTLNLANISNYAGQIIAQTGDISLNGAKALNSSAQIKASDNQQIILNTQEPNVESSASAQVQASTSASSAGSSAGTGTTSGSSNSIDSQQLHIDAKTVTKVGQASLNLNTDTPVFAHLATFNLNQGNLSSNHNLFSDNQGTAVLTKDTNLNFNLATDHAQTYTKVYGKFTGTGTLHLQQNTSLELSQLASSINVNLYNANHQFILDPNKTYLAPHLLGQGKLNLVSSSSAAQPAIFIANQNLANYQGTLNLDKPVTLDLQTTAYPFKISGQGTIRSNFSISSSNTIVTTSGASTLTSQSASNSVLALDLSKNNQFTGTVEAYKGDIAILGQELPTKVSYKLAGSRIILQDNNTDDLDLSKLSITNSQPQQATSNLVNNVKRKVYLNNPTANRIKNFSLEQGTLITQDSVSLHELNNNAVVDIGKHSLTLNNYDDNQGQGIILVDLTNITNPTNKQTRITIDQTPASNNQNANQQNNTPARADVQLKLTGDYHNLITSLRNRVIPIVKTTGKLNIINLDQVNQGSLHKLVVRNDASTNSLTLNSNTFSRPILTYYFNRIIGESALAILRQITSLQTISLTSDDKSEFKRNLGIRTFYSSLQDLDYKTYSRTDYATQYKNSSSVTGWQLNASNLFKINNIIVNPMLDVKYASVSTTSQVRQEDNLQPVNVKSTLISTKFKLNFKVHGFKLKTYLGYNYARFTPSNKSANTTPSVSMLNVLVSIGHDDYYVRFNRSSYLVITNTVGMNYLPIVSNNLSSLDSAVTDLTNDSPFNLFYKVNFNFYYQHWNLDLAGQYSYSPSKLTLHGVDESVVNELTFSSSLLGQATISYQFTPNFGVNLQTEVNNYYYSLNLDAKLGINFSW